MNRHWMMVCLVCLFVGSMAMTVTLRARTPPPSVDSPLAQWLAMSPEQFARLDRLDPRYRQDAAELAERLHQDRHALAELMEDQDATDMQILEQVERVILSHNALERRVAEHLVAMRHELETDQRQRLGQLVADEVRGGMGQRWRGGQGRGPAQGRDDDDRPRHGQRQRQAERDSSASTGPAVAGSGASIRDTIDYLFAHHQQIERHVEDLPDGVLTTTTSADDQVVEGLRRHVRQMKGRLQSGQPMRRGDPLFREIFQHHTRMTMTIEDIPHGVRVRQVSDDPQMVLLIRQHAHAAVSEFVKIGPDREHRPTPLPEGYHRR